MVYATSVFLAQAVAVSLSGVMAPGPVTAATMAAGARRKHAGALMALGHAIVELPLVVLVVLGAETVFKAGWFRTGVGLAGGVILLLLAGMTIAGLRRLRQEDGRTVKAACPVWTGMIVTGGNPYFLLWWATVGLALATRAMEIGVLAFALFAVVHWLCDLVWMEVLSQASYRGAALLGLQGQRMITAVCAAAMAIFGVWFIVDAGRGLLAA